MNHALCHNLPKYLSTYNLSKYVLASVRLWSWGVIKKEDIFDQKFTFQENYCILLSHQKLGKIQKKKFLTKNGILNKKKSLV